MPQRQLYAKLRAMAITVTPIFTLNLACVLTANYSTTFSISNAKFSGVDGSVCSYCSYHEAFSISLLL